MPALNWWFGATAAVTPQKRQCENERLSPAWTAVEAAAAPSRWDVRRQSQERCRKSSLYWKFSTVRQSIGIEYRTDNWVQTDKVVELSTNRQSSGIEYRTDNELQTDKVVELSTVPTIEYKPTK